MGQRSVAMRSLAHVEHPHFMHFPDPLNDLAFQKLHFLQTFRRPSTLSSDKDLKPDLAHRIADFDADKANADGQNAASSGHRCFGHAEHGSFLFVPQPHSPHVISRTDAIALGRKLIPLLLLQSQF